MRSEIKWNRIEWNGIGWNGMEIKGMKMKGMKWMEGEDSFEEVLRKKRKIEELEM